MSREQPVERIRVIAERVAGSLGLEIFDVQLRRESIGWVLRVVIDRVPALDGGAPEDDAVSVADCQRVSEDLGAILDVEDPLDHQYTLEVSSPGLDRPLRGAPDYRRFAGRLAKIVVDEPVDGQMSFRGRIVRLEDDDVVFIGEGGREHRVPLGSIVRGRLEVEF